MMRNILKIAAMAAGFTTLSVPMMAADTLYLNCKCTAVYNSSFPSRSPKCELYSIPDITAIIDFTPDTIDLKSSDRSAPVNGLSGPATISPGTISAHWNSSPVSQYARKIDLTIDRTTGEYSLAWDFGETKIRWSGICKKGDALPTQF